tara:strand:- start:877 stop:1062 length:186 start_codon:yes stop_codon:yes gene_type:complete
MQFIKKTSSGGLSGLSRFIIKVFFIIIVIFFGLILISKVDFPAPNKKIEKIIPNENFKTIK